MAVDKKSDYVGNHGGAYTDADGMSRQFTYVDHDKKSKMTITTSKEDISEAKRQLKEFRDDTVKAILSLPPSAVPELFHIFTIRGKDGIRWDENMVKDPSIDIWKLRTLLGFTEERANINL